MTVPHKKHFDTADELIEYLGGLVPSSSRMPFLDAKEIAATFGVLVAELCDPKRYSLRDRSANLPYSLPVERLKYTKEQVQMALGVVIAELVVELAIGPTDQLWGFLNAAIGASGELRYFSHRPLNFGVGDNSPQVYAEWRESCERLLEKLAEEAPKSPEETGWPSFDAITDYWRTIDQLLPELLTNKVLVAARGT